MKNVGGSPKNTNSHEDMKVKKHSCDRLMTASFRKAQGRQTGQKFGGKVEGRVAKGKIEPNYPFSTICNFDQVAD